MFDAVDFKRLALGRASLTSPAAMVQMLEEHYRRIEPGDKPQSGSDPDF